MTLFKWALLCSRTDSRCFQMDHHQVLWICPCTLRRILKSELLHGFAFILNWYTKLLLLFWYSFCHLRHTCFFVCLFFRGFFLFVFFFVLCLSGVFSATIWKWVIFVFCFHFSLLWQKTTSDQSNTKYIDNQVYIRDKKV